MVLSRTGVKKMSAYSEITYLTFLIHDMKNTIDSIERRIKILKEEEKKKNAKPKENNN